MRNHSATHLLHKALRDLIGPQVEQRGSLVEPERLRFDFTCPRPLTRSELAQIDEQINRWIRADFPVHTTIMPLQQALTTGAMALFGEKYESIVRVVSMGSSTELCGGTHCAATGQIGLYITIQETSVAAGIRRIEALTGRAAEAYLRRRNATVEAVAATLQTQPDTLEGRVEQLVQELAAARRQIAQYQRETPRERLSTGPAGPGRCRRCRCRDNCRRAGRQGAARDGRYGTWQAASRPASSCWPPTMVNVSAFRSAWMPRSPNVVCTPAKSLASSASGWAAKAVVVQNRPRAAARTKPNSARPSTSSPNSSETTSKE